MTHSTLIDEPEQYAEIPAIPSATRDDASFWRRLAGIFLVLAAATLYMLTLDNGLQPEELVGGDLITHQYAQVQARFSNAPGYPIYTMVGWLWYQGIHSTLVAAGIELPNPIPILSSYSTVWALLSLWLLYQVICMTTDSDRRQEGNWPIAFLVSAFYAVTYFFWYYATTTEQYTSAIAQTLAIVMVLILWLRRQENLWLLFTLAFLCGLSLAHMLTVAFIAPPVVVAVLWTKPDLLRKPKAVAGSIAAALLPLVSYAFVFVRGSQHPEWWGSQTYGSATEWFWSFLSTSQGREELLWAFEPGRPFFGNDFPGLIGQELTWILVIAGVAGIAFQKKPLRFVLYATLLTYVVFSWSYRFGNWFQVILPAYAVIMIGVGALADRWQTYVLGRGEKKRKAEMHRLAAAIGWATPIALLLIAVVWRFDTSLDGANSRNRPEDTGLDRAAVLLTESLPTDSAVFASVEDALALQYLTEIWQIRPDVEVVSSQRAGEAISEKPLFVTWNAAQTLMEEMQLDGVALLEPISPDWLAVHASGDQASGAQTSATDNNYVELGEPVVPGTVLQAYSLRRAPNGEPVVRSPPLAYDLLLDWRIGRQQWPEDVSISVRPTIDGEYIADPSNPSEILLTDHVRPAQLQFTAAPPSADIAIIDPYRIQFPTHLPDEGGRPGAAIVLYRRLAEGFEDIVRLDLPLDEGD